MGDKNFIAGIGCTNVDILYSGIDRLPNEGEEIYAKHFSLQLGGGVPATLINLGRLGIKTNTALMRLMPFRHLTTSAPLRLRLIFRNPKKNLR